MADAGAVQRRVRAALQINGGFAVKLRMPGQAVANSASEELGLAAPAFVDLPIGLAVWRKAGDNKELLLDATAVTELAGGLDVASAESLLSGAVGIAVSGVVYAIEEVTPFMVGEQPGAYRVRVQHPAGPWSTV